MLCVVDWLVLFCCSMCGVVLWYGYCVSFMGKLYLYVLGSGMYVYVSLYDDVGCNLFVVDG